MYFYRYGFFISIMSFLKSMTAKSIAKIRCRLDLIRLICLIASSCAVIFAEHCIRLPILLYCLYKIRQWQRTVSRQTSMYLPGLLIPADEGNNKGDSGLVIKDWSYIREQHPTTLFQQADACRH